MDKGLVASILRDVAQIRRIAEELENQLQDLVPVPEFPDPLPDEHLEAQLEDQISGDGGEE